MDRLTIMGEFCPRGKRNDIQGIVTRGEFIFSNSETDKKNAAAFLIILLDSVERWAQLYPKEANGNYSIFLRSFQTLREKGVTFPSATKSKPEESKR